MREAGAAGGVDSGEGGQKRNEVATRGGYGQHLASQAAQFVFQGSFPASKRAELYSLVQRRRAKARSRLDCPLTTCLAVATPAECIHQLPRGNLDRLPAELPNARAHVQDLMWVGESRTVVWAPCHSTNQALIQLLRAGTNGCRVGAP